MSPHVITLRGHLTLVALESELRPLSERLAKGEPATLVVDCLDMESYEVEARAAFIEFHKRWRPSLLGIAVLTRKVSWKGVVLAMAMASGTKMRAFDDPASARAWLSELA
ncbi:MAG: hypothetical protein KC776_31905 [Myxococcales bacterium]|nr:hypothetical protein [Myxococcales bacterium]MCB9581993.1 hypothetical protein [Polyangiaceae bacterium]